MAIVETGIFQKMRGKLGNLVVYEVNGQKRLRTKPQEYNDRKSPEQLAHRSKVRGIAALYKRLDAPLRFYWKELTQGTTMNGYNLFLSMNIHNLNEEGKIKDMSRLCLCKGGQSLPCQARAFWREDGMVEITWDSAAPIANERFDYMEVVTCLHQEGQADEITTIPIYDSERQKGSYLWDISKKVEIKGSLYLYGIFKDRVTGEVSDSFFLGCLDNANGK